MPRLTANCLPYLLPTPYSLLPTPYSRFPIPDSRFPIPDSLPNNFTKRPLTDPLG
ncbi:hypothetical protein [Moorena sp. SIO3I6]|uniref:hypothetical protein n=1 Tax=Moorena sp. SIO3I6 TaxID=2607831 RepID=UPI0013F6F8F0|nr:hypothetical protein [Moorena sp. SIO3I6]NEP26794.1 hypothetical protein [Moorena sp. SIO3I6]